MKTNFYFFIASFLCLFLGMAGNPAEAQNCANPLGLTKNTEFVYQVTDKGKNRGTLNNKVLQQASDAKGHFITTFKSTRMGNNKRTENAEEFTIRCVGDTLYLDAMMLMREQALKAFEGKDFDYIRKDVAYPQNLQVGMTLPNGKLGVRVRSASATITQVSMTATDRKVIAQEKITTPAGTFDTYKISYQYVVHLDALGMPLRDVYQVEEHFSLEHGIVKVQFFTKRGKKAKGMELISKRSPVQALQN
ncbi:hypothetical protein [Rufibacter sp. LB8]|uniref:TapB family protein n=1 Tax=Rufibacter sp. LB8 TaxID=2777781 RepID=UPI00178C2E53|nr:hypothetical protein [Rufibacter sp. LB8]